jgi:hypothetical protein
MLTNMKPGWRYFYCMQDGIPQYWAYDPQRQKCYWVEHGGEMYASSISLAQVLQFNDMPEVMNVDPDLVMDEGL